MQVFGVSPGTLRALSHCRWPILVAVALRSWHTTVVGSDFSWQYKSQERVQEVDIYVPGADVAADVEQELSDLVNVLVRVIWEGMLADAEGLDAEDDA